MGIRYALSSSGLRRNFTAASGLRLLTGEIIPFRYPLQWQLRAASIIRTRDVDHQ